jgi:hypothetical protein
MQNDGNLVIYSWQGIPIWWSNTGGLTGSYFSMQADGSLTIATQNNGTILFGNSILNDGQSILTPGLNYTLAMQTDGNLVEYNSSGQALWSSGTAGNSGDKLVMQNDGNLVIYSWQGIPIWWSNTGGNKLNLSLESNGNMVIYSSSGQPIWSSNS